MSESLGDLSAGQTALEPAAQVEIELVVVTHRGERGDGDQAPIAQREIESAPQVVENHVVGELHELRRDRRQFIVHRPGPCRVHGESWTARAYGASSRASLFS